VLINAKCWEVKCGDGVRVAGEECDDGNLSSGDGCSPSCTLEKDCTAPQITSVTVYKPYRRLEVAFDVEVYAASNDVCAVFLSQDLIGEAPRCWVEAALLILEFGSRPKLAERLHIAEGAILTALCPKTRSYDVQIAYEPSGFSLELSGPAKVSSCQGSIQISTEFSRGTYGQTLKKVDWTLDAILPVYDAGLAKEITAVLQGNFDGVRTQLRTDKLPTRSSFAVRAVAFDFSGSNSTALFSFISEEAASVTVLPLGFQRLSPRVEDQLVIRVEALTNSACSGGQTEGSLEFAWELLALNSSPSSSQVIDANQYGRILVIPAYSFAPGDHLSLMVSAWPTNRPSQGNSLKFEVVFQESLLVPVISPQIVVLNQFEQIVLNANRSDDPSHDPTQFGFQWSLYGPFSQLVQSWNSSEVLLQGLSEGLHTLELTASKAQRTTTASLSFKVASDFSTVTLDEFPKTALIRGQEIVLSTSRPATFTSNSLTPLTSALTSTFKAVYDPALEADHTVISVNEAFEYRLEVAPTPSQGGFQVSPASGSSFDTVFELKADSWSGEDLRYQFSFKSQEGTYLPLTDLTYFSSVKTALPTGDPSLNYTLLLRLKVFSRDGACSIRDTAVTVVPGLSDVGVVSSAGHFERSLNVSAKQMNFLTALALPAKYEYFNEAKVCECSKTSRCVASHCVCDPGSIGDNCRYSEPELTKLQSRAKELVDSSVEALAALPKLEGIVLKFVLTVKEVLTHSDAVQLQTIAPVLAVFAEVLSVPQQKATLEHMHQALDRVFAILQDQSDSTHTHKPKQGRTRQTYADRSLQDSAEGSSLTRDAHQLYLSVCSRLHSMMIPQELPLLKSFMTTKLFLSKSVLLSQVSPPQATVATVQTFNSSHSSYLARAPSRSSSLVLVQYDFDPYALDMREHFRAGAVLEVFDGDIPSDLTKVNVTVPTASFGNLSCLRLASWNWTEEGCRVVEQTNHTLTFHWSNVVVCECTYSPAYTAGTSLHVLTPVASDEGHHQEIQLFPWLYLAAFLAFEAGWLLWAACKDSRDRRKALEHSLNQSLGSFVVSPASRKSGSWGTYLKQTHSFLQIFCRYDGSLSRPWRVVIFSTRALVMVGWLSSAETSLPGVLVPAVCACSLAAVLATVSTKLCKAYTDDPSDVRVAPEDNFKSVMRSSPPIKLQEATSPKQAWLPEEVQDKPIPELKQPQPTLNWTQKGRRICAVFVLMGTWSWGLYMFCTSRLGWEVGFAVCFAADLLVVQSGAVVGQVICLKLLGAESLPAKLVSRKLKDLMPSVVNV
jgi:cysteine-rich repeat protein